MITAQIDQASLARFQKALADGEKYMRKSANGAVIWGAIKFAQSARKATRDQLKASTWAKRKVTKTKEGRRTVYKVHYKKQSGAETIKTFAKAPKQKGPPRVSPQKGLAEQSWKWMLAAMNRAGKGAGVYKGKKSRAGTVKVDKKLNGANPSIRMLNKLTYLDVAFPGVVSTALNKASKGMEKQINDRIDRMKW